MTSVELKVMQNYEELNSTEKKVADYFLENTSSVFQAPIAELAQKSGVSQAAWVRFAKTLGFAGLKDLKKCLFSEFNESSAEQVEIFADIKDYENFDSLNKALCSSSMQAIKDTSQALDSRVLSHAVNMIIGSNSIRLFGLGASGNVAEDFQSKLLRIGMNVCFHYDTHIQLTYAANAMQNDVALLISNSGCTKEVLEMAHILKENNVPTISLTRVGSSPIAKSTDLQLYTVSPEIYYRSGAMSSRLAQLFVIDVLYTAIANHNYEQVLPRLQKSHESCRTHRILND